MPMYTMYNLCLSSTVVLSIFAYPTYVFFITPCMNWSYVIVLPGIKYCVKVPVRLPKTTNINGFGDISILPTELKLIRAYHCGS
jgi:hypothetical protein